MIDACDACDHRIHPPQPICPRCLSRAVTAHKASGTGTIYSYTVNRQSWMPALPVPYVIALVALDDQPGVRLTARLIDCEPEEVAISLPVQVAFEKREDVYVPVFRLVRQAMGPR